MDTQDGRIPVTLLTGFLGAGKTTLLNHLIRDPAAGRIAVIMNEFGDVGLDHDLIEEVTDDVVLMHAGCLCCSIRGDLAKTLVLLLSRKKRGELDFDRVVIETTGIAAPGPILSTMATDRMIAPYFRTDGVVTVADAATGPQTLDAQFEAVSQIAMADLIVLSKTDLVTPAALDQFEARLACINGRARHVRGEHGQVPAGELFGLSAMRPNATSDEVANWLGAASPEPDRLAGSSGLEQEKSGTASPSRPQAGVDAHHDGRIVSASIKVSGSIPGSVFDFWIDMLMALKGPNILRMKGIIHVEDVDAPFVFHGVQHIFDAPVPLKSWSGQDKTSRVVVIARDMDKDDIEASLEILRMRPTEVAASSDPVMADTSGLPR